MKIIDKRKPDRFERGVLDNPGLSGPIGCAKNIHVLRNTIPVDIMVSAIALAGQSGERAYIFRKKEDLYGGYGANWYVTTRAGVYDKKSFLKLVYAEVSKTGDMFMGPEVTLFHGFLKIEYDGLYGGK